jgi:2-polyprenyl-3-methyl-5-hydroxy-6-metoxy-1,4-benzoquinol methylase
MQLNYLELKQKYLSLFNGNEESFNFIITDVIFAYKEVYQFIINKKINSVLEVGCGTGILLKELKESFPKIKFAGLDPNESGFHGYKSISQKIIDKDYSLKIINSTIENYNPLEKYDLIFSFNVFEHVRNQNLYLNKTHNLLSKEGSNIIFSPNYDFPYEPHFILPIIINKNITKKLFKKKIFSHENRTKEHGLWEGLNLNGKKKIEKILLENNYSYVFDLSIKDRMINRMLSDKHFKKRQGVVATLTIIGKYIFLDKILFNILRIPFPYLKLIIKK